MSAMLGSPQSAIADVLNQCLREGIKLAADGENLRVKLPQGRTTHPLLALIKEHKPGILEALRSARAQVPQYEPIPRVPRREHVRPSFSQERWVLIQQVTEARGTSNLTIEVDLRGVLNRAALANAVAALMERQVALRTVLPLDDGGRPFLKMLDVPTDALQVLDVTTSDEQALREFVRAMHEKEFDLQRERPLRAHLLVLAEDSYKLVLVTHHAASDGWSVGILLGELAEIYNANLQGRRPRLPQLDIDYLDYAAWQQSSVEADWFRAGMKYWRERLQDAPTLHSLPTDRPRPVAPTLTTRSHEICIDRQILKSLEEFAVAHEATLFMVLMSGLATLFHRYSDERDLIIGTLIANRVRDEIAPLIGLFMNELAVRVQIAPEDRFLDVLKRVRTNYLSDVANQSIPFERVAAEVAGDARNLNHTPLVQLTFTLHNNATPILELEGLESKCAFTTPNNSPNDLDIAANETDQGLRIVWQYATDLFDGDRIERMAKHFTTLLCDALREPGKQIGQLELTDAAEREFLVKLGNDTRTQYDSETGFHHLFEAQVALTPEKTALIFNGRHFSYTELNQHANRLAHYLIAQRKAGPGSIVGVYLDRSPEMLIALVAIAKAGAAYLPLDPRFPAGRLSYMVQHAQASTILSSKAVRGELTIADEHAVYLDEPSVSAKIAACSSANPDRHERGHRGSNLVYVIYTSGSTGTPKGVMIEHRSLTNFLLSIQREPGISSSDRVLAVTTPSFDIHALELFSPLIAGGTVILATPDEFTDPSVLVQLINSDDLTVVQTTPTQWIAMLDVGWKPVRSIKVLVGGEALSETLKDKLLAYPLVELWNMYGPTETCVWSAVKRIEGPVVIGTPMANTRFYVLDRELMPVPIGVGGDLYIAGDGLARGYLNQPDLTANAFLTKLPAAIPEERIYKTGDCVARRSNGELIFVGRRDNQVKVNGFRIEIAEVLAGVESLDFVKQAAVVLKRREDKSTYLAAFITVKDGHEWPGAAIKQLLQPVLPHYMIPRAFERLDHLPTTPNGKVDLKQLAQMQMGMNTREESAREFPSTHMQRVIAEIWADLLNIKLERIALDDDLLAMGADSIRALMFVGRAKKRGIECKVRDVYGAGTVRALAALAKESVQSRGGELYAGPVALTVDQRMALMDEHLVRRFFINLVFDSRRRVDVEALRATMLCMVKAHDMLRARLHKEEGGWTQTVSAEVEREYVFGDAISCAWDDPQVAAELRSVLERAHGRMSLENGPLICVVLIADAHGVEKLLFSVSHLIADGFSTIVLLEDFFDTYHQIRAGREPQLRNFLRADGWAPRYRDLVNSERFCSQIATWEALPWGKCAPFPLDFPHAASRFETSASSSRMFVDRLDAALSEAIHTGSQEQLGISARDFLLIALGRVLMRWSHADAVSMQILDAGRKDLQEALGVDLSRTVAAFALRCCVFLEWIECDDELQMIKQMHAQFSRLPNGGAGLPMLKHVCENADVVARARKLPDAEIWFNYIGAVRDSLTSDEAPNIEIPSKPSSVMKHVAGVSNDADSMRKRTLGLGARFENGRFEFVWEYSSTLHTEETIRGLARSFNAELLRLASSLLDERQHLSANPATQVRPAQPTHTSTLSS